MVQVTTWPTALQPAGIAPSASPALMVSVIVATAVVAAGLLSTTAGASPTAPAGDKTLQELQRQREAVRSKRAQAAAQVDATKASDAQVNAALASIVMPALVLTGTAVSLLLPQARAALLAQGPRGLSEMLYAYTSAGNNNGSAFAGLAADQPWLNLTLGLVMFVARFGVIVLTLALAGSLVTQQRRPVTTGTMPTHTPVFGVLLFGIILLLAGLTFFPSLALGPLAEALS